MKLGAYVPINDDNKCWDLSVDRKFKMATIGGERLHIIFMGNAFSPSSIWEVSRDDNAQMEHLWWQIV